VAAGIVAMGLVVVLAQSGGATAPHAPKILSERKPGVAIAASHALAAGVLVRPDDIQFTSASQNPPAGAIFSKADAVGHVTTQRFAAGETILRAGLRDGTALGIASHVPPGERAFAIRVSEEDIVGGFLQSGDHVDVLATIPGSAFPSKSSGEVPDRSRTVLLLQNVSVLAVGDNPATRGSVQSGARTATLALAPDDLTRLALAERFGKVSLAIRMPGDDALSAPALAVLADLVPVSTDAQTLLPASAPRARSRRIAGIPFYTGARTSALPIGVAQ
jgi:pilus assembly protein CpaB